MNDRELLELAAKAAGVNASWHSEEDADLRAADEGMFLNGERSPDNSKYWNPLTSDGDAFRLAVKLRIDVIHSLFAVTAWANRTKIHDEVSMHELVDEESRREAATRRAITRAAAEIQRQRESK